MLQFILLILLAYSRGGGVVIKLDNHELTEVPGPEMIPNDTIKLYMEKNQIHYIPEGALCHMYQINIINLENNELSSLGNLSCVGHSLLHLYLSDNPLKQLPASTFEGLDVLETLVAQRTQLTEFPHLWSVPDTLSNLDIGSNTDIGGLLPSAEKMSQFTTLRNLQLNAIGLTLFPDQTGLAETLSNIGLGYSAFPKIHRNDLCKLPKILETQ